MGTPVQLFVRLTTYLVIAGAVLWAVTLACDRVFALHSIYTAQIARIKEEEWLRVKCQEPEFFRNLRSHTTLCTEVESNARRSALLFAVNEVMQGTYLCGRTSCTEQGTHVLLWFMQLSMPMMICVTLFGALVCPVLAVQILRAVISAIQPSYHYGGLNHTQSINRLRPLSYQPLAFIENDGPVYDSAYEPPEENDLCTRGSRWQTHSALMNGINNRHRGPGDRLSIQNSVQP
jgi:hypothetical protein